MVYTQHTNYIDRFCGQSSWANAFPTFSIDVDSNIDGIINLFFSHKTKKKYWLNCKPSLKCFGSRLRRSGYKQNIGMVCH